MKNRISGRLPVMAALGLILLLLGAMVPPAAAEESPFYGDWQLRYMRRAKEPESYNTNPSLYHLEVTMTLNEDGTYAAIGEKYPDIKDYLCLKAEDIKDDAMFIQASPYSVIEATIRVYELLGAEVYLYFDVNDVSFTARVNPRTAARPGDTVRFALDMSKIHVFDKDTELVILN